MIRICVISDTHLKEVNLELSNYLISFLGEIDLLLHAGDLVNISVLNFIIKSQIMAVAGNMDDYMVSQKLPKKRILKIANKRVGVIHGEGSPSGLKDRVSRNFKNIDILIFGHSHRPFNMIKNGVLYFNPGSFFRNNTGSRTLGLITIGKKIKSKIILIR